MAYPTHPRRYREPEPEPDTGEVATAEPEPEPAPEPAPAPVEPAEEAGPGMLGILERISSVVLPIGVALYAVLYVGVEQIYEVFNLSPQQAGIDQSVLFGRLLLTVILLLVLAVPVIGMVVGVVWLLNAMTRGLVHRVFTALRRRPWFVGLVAGVWCGATYWGLIQVIREVEVGAMVVIAVGLGVLAFLIPFRLMRRKPIGRAGMKLVVLSLTGIGLGFALIGTLVDGAVEVQETGRVRDVLLYVGFQDQWTIVHDAEKDEPLYGGRSVMLLGESDGAFAFYDCDKRQTFRRPVESTILTELLLSPEHEAGFQCGGLAK